MAGLGSDSVSIKGDAESATVEPTVEGKTYTRTFTRVNGDIDTQGEAYLAEPALADLFAFLIESNEARRAVELTEGLRKVIM
jgi:hypothetical protein